MLIVPYKAGSLSAKALAESLGVKRFRLSDTNPRRGNSHLINWGNSSNWWLRCFFTPSVLNHPDAVRTASCKLSCFDKLEEQGVTIPEYFKTQEEAVQALSEDSSHPIVCRTVLNGNSGVGIVIADTSEDVVQAPLYTRYIPKQDEYRVHVAITNEGPRVFDVQKKARRLETPDEEVNWQVRNLEGGFVYKREGVNPGTVPESVLNEAMNAVQALGLDFGAVDVIWNQYRGTAYVLEVNTAPGLEGMTLIRYTQMVRHLLYGDECPFWREYQSQPEEEELLSSSTDTELNTEPVVESIQDEDPGEVSVSAALIEHRISELSKRLQEMRSNISGIEHELELLQEVI